MASVAHLVAVLVLLLLQQSTLLTCLSAKMKHPLPPTQRQLCEPDTEPPKNRFNSTERLLSLRQKMKAVGVEWYLETGLNRMLAAPQPSEKYRQWISGFTGSSGQVLITDTAAYLFTDSRYTLQADQELDCANWAFYDSPEGSLSGWVAAYISDSDSKAARLFVDSRQIRVSDYESLQHAGRNSSLVTLAPMRENLIDQLWNDSTRPQPVAQLIYPLGQAYTGKTWQVKVEQTRQAVASAGADFLAITGLDETAYLLNLRATVLANFPYFPSLVLMSQADLLVFVDSPSDLLANETLREHLNLTADGSCRQAVAPCPKLHPLTELATVAAQVVTSGSTVWLDGAACSYSVFQAVSVNNSATVRRQETPVKLAKAVKNSAEQAAYTACSLMDSAALVAFLGQLERNVAAGQRMTELSASELLATYRAKVPDFRGLSFDTIAASGPNAAVVHYRPTAVTDRAIQLTDAFLLDSGGQYLGCTTDVTRTLYYGPEPPAEVRDAYTRVLMGVIDLFNLTWPGRLTSRNIDPFARHNLWSVAQDYGHGTGHGIGLFLGVHEGPNGIGRDVALVEGNFQSIEPGFYQREAAGVLGFGIRLETISGVRKLPGATSSYLRFFPVTWVPFERKLINVRLLSADQLRWLNWYHSECRRQLPEALKAIGQEAETAAWLTAATEPIVGPDEGGPKAAVGLRPGGSLGQLVAVAATSLLAVLAACR